MPGFHISFFESETLRQALSSAGFTKEFRGYLSRFTDIIRFKVLKNPGILRSVLWQYVRPWPLFARMADTRFGITHHLIGWAS
jgi:hypothetical protein